jgi:hypothetical protein
MEAVQKGLDSFGPFQRVQGMLNAELDHGPVHERSGSNRGSEPNLRITRMIEWFLCFSIRSTSLHFTNIHIVERLDAE